ncbi:predicted protein [Chaetomium globosum CBS 148.51]|uniref:Uncharacterized protein n=1 Tax=Chaetomium globosum (strain ATCC 6205 / CBS 148.51 / DSM 1962 / NBRC 6347 / NRRL 1970) TaxID=306901 RepID=Q2HHR7_CHAGB|nr:uncharacterized protein CHGG_00237 [Chaetomium globosum CBS 148.51]EAQ92002.1 predicted protein [Chaetomium globosum CBS 148.51]
MQLSSLFLSATALLAQAASADYLLYSSRRALFNPPAQIQTRPPAGYLPGCVGFTRTRSQNAEIALDAEGDIGSKFFLLQTTPTTWALHSKEHSYYPITEPGDLLVITGPFTVDESGRFVYNGTEVEDAGWVACKQKRNEGFSTIYLTASSVQDESCREVEVYAYDTNQRGI